MGDHLIWTADGAALALVLIAGIADWRRARRTNLDATGWVPWRGIQMAAIFAAIALTVIALHR
jgi:hypothetical protein